MNRAVIVEDADVLVRALKNPHIITALFRALDNLQPSLDRLESDASGTCRFPIASAAIEDGRQALREARGQS